MLKSYFTMLIVSALMRISKIFSANPDFKDKVVVYDGDLCPYVKYEMC